MALKQMEALAALREAAGEVIETSLCDVQGNWLALVNTQEGKRLAFAAKGEAALSAQWKDVEKEAEKLTGIHKLTYKLETAINRKDSFYQHIIAEKNK